MSMAEEDLYHGVYGVRVSDAYKRVPTPNLPAKALGLGLVQDTSAHGIGHIFYARGIIKRFLWLIFFLGATGYLIYTIYNLVIEYLNYDVNVKVTVETATSLSFPAVTVCNQNILRKSYVNENVFNAFFEKTTEVDQYDDSPFDREEEGYFGSEADEDSEYFDSLIHWISGQPEVEKFEMGHQLDDLVMDCTYSKYPCNTTLTFERLFNSFYGNCYTFNSGLKGNIFKQSQTGPNYGLTLVMNIEQGEYLPNITAKAGVRVVIHPQNDVPFPEDIGLDVAVGMATSIGLKKVTVSRLGGDYGSCTAPVKNIRRNAYEEKYNGTGYTLPGCQKTCLQKNFIQTCGCFDESYINEATVFDEILNKSKDEIEPCNTRGREGECIQNVTSLYEQGTLECPLCTEPCMVDFYEPTISTASWPAINYKTYLLEQLGTDDAEAKILISKGLDTANFLQLQVYYEELNYETIAESQAYTITKFMSDMGGAMGMCIGASFITAIEFVELFTDLLILIVAKAVKSEKHRKALHPATKVSDIGMPEKLKYERE